MIRSLWFAALVAVVLGAGTCAAVVLIRWNDLVGAEHSMPAREGVVTSCERDWDFWSPGIEKLSTDLRDERATLEGRRKELEAVEIRLEAEKQELARVRAEVEEIRREISEQVPVLHASERSNLKTLSRTYAAMRPQQAVAILGEMDDASAVKILAMMKPDVVGGILQEMATPGKGPEGAAARAAKLSEQLRLLQQQEEAEVIP